MGTVFTILVIAMALLSIVAVMVLILREKVDHDAHLKYVRSPWTENAAEAQKKVDAHFQKTDAEKPASSVAAPEPEATTGAVDTALAEEATEENKTT